VAPLSPASPPLRAAPHRDAPPPEETETAGDLLQRAGAARLRGDVGGALDLFARLQKRFPQTDEARLSHVSMGTLLLGAGRAAEAEQQLALYLALGRGGELTEEALADRARCLELLGRADDERRVWSDLLKSFPSTLYGARARQRLAQLGAPVP
jgi:TolA-binding protein